LMIGVPPQGESEIEFLLPKQANALKGRLHVPRKSIPVESSIRFKDASTPKALGMSSASGSSYQIDVPKNTASATWIFRNLGSEVAKVCLEAVALDRRSESTVPERTP
jgi:hypothetical protein